jgi:hypothetical protein
MKIRFRHEKNHGAESVKFTSIRKKYKRMKYLSIALSILLLGSLWLHLLHRG